MSVNQHVQLAAIAEDKDGAPLVASLNKWSVRDEGRNTAGRISPRGDFEARIPGTFKVIAEGGGRKAQVKVTVSDGLRRPGANDKPTGPVIEVSNREGKGKGSAPQRSIQQTVKCQIAAQRQRRYVEGRYHLLLKFPNCRARPQLSLTSVARVSRHPGRRAGRRGGMTGTQPRASDPINRVGDPPGAPIPKPGGRKAVQFPIWAAQLLVCRRAISISSLGATSQRARVEQIGQRDDL